jgi:hypothetical protein
LTHRHPTRFTETDDPAVTKLLDEAPKDKAEKLRYLVENISGFNHIQRVRLLIELPKGDFDAFVDNRPHIYENLLHDLDERPGPVHDRGKYLASRTTLRYGRPRWEVQAEMIRHFRDQGDDYPLSLDPVIDEHLWADNVDLAATTALDKTPAPHTPAAHKQD